MAEEEVRNKKPRLRSPTRRSREKAIEVCRVKETGKNPGRPWTVTGVYLDGKRVRRFFATRDEAEAFARLQKLAASRLGHYAERISPALAEEALRCQEALQPYGKSLIEAVREYVATLEARRRSVSVEELFSEVIRVKRQDGRSRRYVHELGLYLRRFARDFGQRPVASLESREIDDWLRALPGSPIHRNNFRRNLSVAFSHAVDRGYLEANPMVKTSVARVVDRPPEIFSPEEAARFLEACRTLCPEIVPMHAIGLFAGLRAAEIERLDWKEIKLARGHIEVTAEKSKTARRRLVPIEPNLGTWLKPFERGAGPVVPPNAVDKRLAAMKAAGLPKWPRNGERHSYASYHLAHFQDAAKTALNMGHTSTALLFNTYRELVTPEEAAEYWALEAPKGGQS
ncbi:tyrosine-type recombinase/integrase [Verrucomicrobium sp. 3C]|uniref:tyrosine-type recombinase/integrase n=1 Tax=Verrucomicrobium sp. 3C TaxID=1134055 RepID=UPI00035F98EE|nr:tyrosine-type recombinase/integrase [Verrucomicrobium sp. 3C]